MKQDAQRPDPARTAPAGAPPSEPRARLWQARSALVWERLGPAVWAPLSILGVFAALALFNLLPHLPGWLHAAVLVLLVGAFLLAAIAGFRRLRLPDEAEARRRLERDSGLPHRPLNTLRDRSAGGDPMAEALWRLHQERTRAAMRRLRVAWPDSTVPSHDRFALRALVVLLIVVAGASGWGDWRPRLMAAVSPRFDGGAVAATATLDLWVTPPRVHRPAPGLPQGRQHGRRPDRPADRGAEGQPSDGAGQRRRRHPDAGGRRALRPPSRRSIPPPSKSSIPSRPAPASR
ncbi:DUF4175 family protein [Azospirillum doebereinerae]|uniref:DUF4175 family protein n=1 Tax=Azospirillum doebereinerae TaxID=92933 RepID=UPI00384B3735